MLEQLKDESVWPIGFRLVGKEKQVGRWMTVVWTIEDVCLYGEEQKTTLAQQPDGYVLPLQLQLYERSDYRFNLSSRDPHLFVVCSEEGERLKPLLITAAQGLAAGYMDGEYQILDMSIPLPVQAWMEAFIGRHGEQLDVRRKGNKDKRKEKKGLISGN
ncbi:DUF3305 domain-containing protein [Photobacterium ganghwense]|uniref:DUF3305 domain-containing protein n=1 Tax=Photobacterium ganghwense TaxID=320778 RepID=UPI00069E7B47|nr:DUF3305 domain-containing protein [Photobacterium ganghwense]PSU08616.1 DUF3305 domain-containing protein [Photobacterium ganghwense]